MTVENLLKKINKKTVVTIANKTDKKISRVAKNETTWFYSGRLDMLLKDAEEEKIIFEPVLKSEVLKAKFVFDKYSNMDYAELIIIADYIGEE